MKKGIHILLVCLAVMFATGSVVLWSDETPVKMVPVVKLNKELDMKEVGANVSRINCSPSKINGVETHFQNAGIQRLCAYPYFVFVALQDIRPEAEIWSSYGPNYHYHKFMEAPEGRDFFAGWQKWTAGKILPMST